MKTNLPNSINIIFLVLFILSSTNSYGAELFGYSEIPNKFLDVPVCVGDIGIKVYPTDPNGTYEIQNCIQTNTTNLWTCPCQKELFIKIPNGTTNTFSMTVQYNIKELINNPINDFNAKRIVQINNLIITKISIEEYKKQQEELKQQNNNILFFIIKMFIFFIVLLILIAIYFFIVKPKVRRSLKMDEDDKLSFIDIIKAIFHRRDVTVKNVKQSSIPITKTSQSSDVEEEARKLLEKLNR